MLGEETLAAEGEAASFDVRAAPPGRLAVTEASAGGTAAASYYRHPELRALGAVAVVEIAIGAALYAADPAPALAVSFSASAAVLRYYVVARNYAATDFAQLAVSDAGPVTGAAPAPAIVFDAVTPDAFGAAEVAPALLAAGDERLVLFRSRAAVPRRERAGRRIQLSRNGDVLIANLPQPGPDRSDAALIIHVSRP